MSDLLGNLESRIKQVASLSFAFYMAGFLARRSQLSALGVAVSLPLTDPIYLVSGAAFAGFTVFALIQPAVLLILATSAVLARLGTRMRLRWSHRARWPLCVSSGVALVASTAWARRQYEQVLALRAVGLTGGTRAENWIVADLAEGGERCWLLYTELVLALGLSCAAYWLLWRELEELAASTSRYFMVLAGALVTLQIVFLPAAYGVLAQGVFYPVIEASPALNLAGPEAVLLLETDKQLVLQEPGLSRVATVDRSEVHRWVTTRQVNVFRVARDAEKEKVHGGHESNLDPAMPRGVGGDVSGVADAGDGATR